MNSRARKSDLLFDRISRAQPTTSGAYIRASPPVAINKFAAALASACSEINNERVPVEKVSRASSAIIKFAAFAVANFAHIHFLDLAIAYKQ